MALSFFPTLCGHIPQNKDFAIVLTTDGVTDLLTPEEVAERVASYVP